MHVSPAVVCLSFSYKAQNETRTPTPGDSGSMSSSCGDLAELLLGLATFWKEKKKNSLQTSFPFLSTDAAASMNHAVEETEAFN